MELLNATKMMAAYTLGMEPSGRESVVVAIKGSFDLPVDGGVASLAEQQVELVTADVFEGEPGYSATVYECDYAAQKPFCDVLLNGSAYAPYGQPTDQVNVRLQMETIDKAFTVVGNRVWQTGNWGLRATAPEPFTVMPISYGNAFGGMDNAHEDSQYHDAFYRNLVGVGFHVYHDEDAIDGKPLPNTEEPGHPVKSPDGSYNPMAFGAVTRACQPRISYGGTYDDAWAADTFPFLPEDFDPRYFQAAPEDQQLPHPVGGSRVVLTNLSPGGHLEFHLPKVDVPVEFTDAKYDRTEQQAVLDTIVIEPDLGRLLLTWRASHPLKRNISEMRQCVVGRMPRGWYRARALGKTYYPSIARLVASKRGGDE